MTAHLQLFMILGAVVLLLIIFALLKRGLTQANAILEKRVRDLEDTLKK